MHICVNKHACLGPLHPLFTVSPSHLAVPHRSLTNLTEQLRHGLVGRQGREVKLDDDGKVLFSVADCTMYRTGISNGIGYPELCLDDRHAHVLLPSVRAAMRKVKRTDPDRDAVSPHFLRLRDFCEHMLTSISQSTNLTTDDEIPDEDRCYRSHVPHATPCVVQCMSVHVSLCVASVARGARTTYSNIGSLNH